MKFSLVLVTIAVSSTSFCNGFVGSFSSSNGASTCHKSSPTDHEDDRRSFVTKTAAAILIPFWGTQPNTVMAADSLNVDDFLQTGTVAMPMGVSGQAGKAKPVTGIVFRDGSEVSRDSRSGDVLAEILVKDNTDTSIAVLTKFSSPWALATGGIFDVECRDAKTGDGAFLAVTEKTSSNSKLEDIPSSFFLERLFSKTGRFSFYGSPTDIKVRKSYMADDNKNRILEISFSTLSQSTQTEIPRYAIVSATVPQGSNQAVMLVASASANRWKKSGSESTIRDVISSYRAVPAPITNMKVRAKDRSQSFEDASLLR